MSRSTGWLIVACAWLAIAATARSALAQQPRPDAFEDAEEAVPGAVEAEVGQDQLENIDQWVFAGLGAAGARKRLEEYLTRDIGRHDRNYGLTPAQKKKLELAGRHDIKRFFDRVEDAKGEYRRANGDWNKVGTRIFELQRIQNQPHLELFGDASMLAKTLKKSLTPEQIAGHERIIYRARVEWMAGYLDKRLNLTAEQHRRLVALVAEGTPPLKRYGSFDYDAIMFQMSRLPREKFRAVLDEAQCKELTIRFDQARRMESILVSEGYLAGGPPAARAGGVEVHRHVEEARR
jgi:hypothetical protein